MCSMILLGYPKAAACLGQEWVRIQTLNPAAERMSVKYRSLLTNAN
jgi:hypothetical protein